MKKVSPHVLRHSTAMHLFQAGVDMAVIALWLGHESLETTHVHVEADLATKERALKKLAPMQSMPDRYRADDKQYVFFFFAASDRSVTYCSPNCKEATQCNSTEHIWSELSRTRAKR